MSDDPERNAISSCFNTQPLEGGWLVRLGLPLTDVPVSTHSRSKAAGAEPSLVENLQERFNTQPLEGGWYMENNIGGTLKVSTHSRSKAAGYLRSQVEANK